MITNAYYEKRAIGLMKKIEPEMGWLKGCNKRRGGEELERVKYCMNEVMSSLKKGLEIDSLTGEEIITIYEDD